MGLMALENIDFGLLLSSITVLLLALSVHEAAHAWMALRLGDTTGRDMGRVTLNPLAHIDPVGTVAFPIVMYLLGGWMFGWAKPVPVSPANFRNPRRDHVLVAVAGPASNVLLAAAFLIVLKLLQAGFDVSDSPAVLVPLFQICTFGVIINAILAAFNMIPIPPLDGSWVLYGLLPEPVPSWIDAVRPFGFILLLLLVYLGALRIILDPVIIFVVGLSQ